jgi:sugar transferase (PEP-CTERM system associated)
VPNSANRYPATERIPYSMRIKAFPTHPALTAGAALFLLDSALAVILWSAVAGVSFAGSAGTNAGRFIHLSLYPAGYLLLLYALGLYRRDALLETRKSLIRAPLAAVLGSLLAAAVTAILPRRFTTDGTSGLIATAVPCFVVAGFVARAALFMLCRHGLFRRSLLIVGAGKRAWDLVWLLQREGRTLAYDIAFVHDTAMGEIDPRLENAAGGSRIIPAERGFLAIAHHVGADQIVVAPDERRGLPMLALLECKTAGFPVLEYLSFLEREIGRVDVKRLELGWLLFSDGFCFGVLDRVLKRFLDLSVSLGGLLLGALPLAAGALAVKLEDGGPVLYHQTRVTRGGRAFRITKLRTMRMDAEQMGAVWAAEQDPRITRAGRLLRRTRLDELPQLFSVLIGDMSLVGPRPERPEFTQSLGAQLPLYHERHLVKAGLTGWAQINYPYGASVDDARSKLSYDLYYVKNQGILLDLLIILQTLRVLLWPGGVR